MNQIKLPASCVLARRNGCNKAYSFFRVDAVTRFMLHRSCKPILCLLGGMRMVKSQSKFREMKLWWPLESSTTAQPRLNHASTTHQPLPNRSSTAPQLRLNRASTARQVHTSIRFRFQSSPNMDPPSEPYREMALFRKRVHIAFDICD